MSCEDCKRHYAQGYRAGWYKALLFFLKKQILRHEKDNDITRKDVEKLEAMGVMIAREPLAEEWIEVTDGPLDLDVEVEEADKGQKMFKCFEGKE